MNAQRDWLIRLARAGRSEPQVVALFGATRPSLQPGACVEMGTGGDAEAVIACLSSSYGAELGLVPWQGPSPYTGTRVWVE